MGFGERRGSWPYGGGAVPRQAVPCLRGLPVSECGREVAGSLNESEGEGMGAGAGDFDFKFEFTVDILGS